MKASILLVLVALLIAPIRAVQATESVPVVIQEEGAAFRGDLHLPKKTSKAVPLVVVIHEWWGKTEHPENRARRIAEELGYAALAVDLFGGKTADNPTDATALAKPFYENPGLAVRRLQAFVAAAPDAAKRAGASLDLSRVAAMGFCFGGSQALNLARAGGLPTPEKLRAVVSFHGGLASSLKATGKIEPKLLVLHGEADPFVKAEEVKAFKAEMNAAGADLKFVGYPGATHAFTNPKSTENGKKFKLPLAYDPKADRASWREMRGFLASALGKSQ